MRNASGPFTLNVNYARPRGELQRVFLGVTAGVLAVSLLLVVLLTLRLQEFITRPIRRLASASEAVARDRDYSVRVESPGRDELGQLTHAFNRMLDQIQSRDAQLRESQQRYEVAVMGSSDGLWDWDLITDTYFLSARWKSIVGFAEEELENSVETFRALLHPADLMHVFDRIAAYLDGRETTYEVEFRLRHKTGSYR